MKEIFILGVGHYTPVCIDLCLACGYTVVGLYHYTDGRTGEYDHGYPIIGTFDDLFNSHNIEGKYFMLSMGNSDIRMKLSNDIVEKGGIVPTLIHPLSCVSQFASISPIGVYVSAFATILADSTIGKNSSLLTHSVVSHNSCIEDGCFIASGAIVGAYIRIERCCFIGMGATLISGKVNVVGEHAYIGAGALVTKSVESYTVVAGVPAKEIKRFCAN